MVELSETTERLIQKFFSSPEQGEARQLLEAECGDNLPMMENGDAISLQRIRFAAIKLSNGNLDELYRAIDLAQTDWRDLLMAADFGSDLKAHEKWAASLVGEN